MAAGRRITVKMSTNLASYSLVRRRNVPAKGLPQVTRSALSRITHDLALPAADGKNCRSKENYETIPGSPLARCRKRQTSACARHLQHPARHPFENMVVPATEGVEGSTIPESLGKISQPTRRHMPSSCLHDYVLL